MYTLKNLLKDLMGNRVSNHLLGAKTKWMLNMEFLLTTGVTKLLYILYSIK